MQELTVASLHGDADVQRNNQRIRRILWIFGIMTLVAIAGIIAAFIWRDASHMNNPNEQASQIIVIAITLVCGCIIIFFWSMKLSPLLAYRRYLKEINNGISRYVEGVVTQVDEQTTFREGLSFYGVLINVGEANDPDDDRILYWDVQHGQPTMHVGDRVYIHAHGNDILGVTRR